MLGLITGENKLQMEFGCENEVIYYYSFGIGILFLLVNVRIS